MLCMAVAIIFVTLNRQGDDPVPTNWPCWVKVDVYMHSRVDLYPTSELIGTGSSSFGFAFEVLVDRSLRFLSFIAIHREG